MIRVPTLLLAWPLCAGLLAGCSRPDAVAVPDGSTDTAQAAGPEKNSQAREPKEGFRFPDDRGGALLTRVLRPEQPPGLDRHPSERAHAASPSAMRVPALPLPRTEGLIPRLPAAPKLHHLRPRLVMEETLDDAAPAPALPQRVELPAGERIRVAAADANELPPLPYLAQPAPDRTALEDPTAEASAARALAATMPRRTTPAPFLRLTLPDPYEHHRPLRLPALAEATAPRTSTPQTPR